MIKPDTTGKRLTATIMESAIGTCTYTINIIEAGSDVQVIHTASGVGGAKVQWVEASLNLLDWEENAKEKIQAKAPAKPELDENGEPKTIVWA